MRIRRDVGRRLDEARQRRRARPIFGIYRYLHLARMNRPRRATSRTSGVQCGLFISHQDHRLQFMAPDHSYSVLRCVVSTTTSLRRRRFSAADAIFRGRLLALHPPHMPHPALPATTPVRHDETVRRRDGELASGWCGFCCSLPAGRRAARRAKVE